MKQWHVEEMILGNPLSVQSAQCLSYCSLVHNHQSRVQERSYLYYLSTEGDVLLQLYSAHPYWKCSCDITSAPSCSNLGVALGLDCLTHLALPILDRCLRSPDLAPLLNINLCFQSSRMLLTSSFSQASFTCGKNCKKRRPLNFICVKLLAASLCQ